MISMNAIAAIVITTILTDQSNNAHTLRDTTSPTSHLRPQTSCCYHEPQ